MALGQHRILLVDDENDTTYSLKVLLEHSGFDVDAYTNPKDVLTNFKPGTYSLAVLDILMPQMDGLQLCELLAKIDSDIRFCFISANAPTSFTARLKRLQDICKVSYIVKPIDSKRLIEQINGLLD